jgi:hypothetical protein
MNIRQLQRKKKKVNPSPGNVRGMFGHKNLSALERNKIVQGNVKQGLPLHSTGQNAMYLLLDKLNKHTKF